MINENITSIVAKIRELEKQLEEELNARQQALSYQLRGHHVRFARAVRRLHRRQKISLLRYLREARPAHILTAPVIYSLVVPFALLDLMVVIYQHTCFRVYGIPRVRRADYVIIDRHQLAYLNAIEKLNCVYCGYGNGVIAFVREVAARTEQYWCPIKHASRVLEPHSRFSHFMDYGDPEAWRKELDKIRHRFDDLAQDPPQD